jgi:uncharacterized nucleotidyltransferase DUF6036
LRREDFLHVVRSAAAVVEDEIVVIGSQAVHGQFGEVPDSLLVSREVDVYPRSAPERAEEIDGALGDGSRFDSTYGYYAHAVGPESAVAPAGWEGRLVRVDLPRVGKLPAATAWCMEIHDLVLAKLARGEPHDLEFVTGAIEAELVDRDQLRLGLELMPRTHRSLVSDRLEGLLKAHERKASAA